MARFILDIRDELGISMILVEHDMGLVMDIADRVLAVDFGVPLATGTPQEVQRHPDVIRAYLGDDGGVRPSGPASTDGSSSPATDGDGQRPPESHEPAADAPVDAVPDAGEDVVPDPTTPSSNGDPDMPETATAEPEPGDAEKEPRG